MGTLLTDKPDLTRASPGTTIMRCWLNLSHLPSPGGLQGKRTLPPGPLAAQGRGASE